VTDPDVARADARANAGARIGVLTAAGALAAASGLLFYGLILDLSTWPWLLVHALATAAIAAVVARRLSLSGLTVVAGLLAFFSGPVVLAALLLIFALSGGGH
jgi:hypothetical protein